MKTIKVKCAECGTEFEKLTKEVKRSTTLGRLHFCNLSCSVSHRNKQLTPEFRKKYCYDISKHAGCRQNEYSSFRYFINKSKSRKKYENSNIDLQYLKELWEKQNGICPYTNLKMLLPKNTLDYHSKKSCCPKRASLDRIDSTKGYIKGNVEFICYAINLAKNSFTREEMKKFFSEINHF